MDMFRNDRTRLSNAIWRSWFLQSEFTRDQTVLCLWRFHSETEQEAIVLSVPCWCGFTRAPSTTGVCMCVTCTHIHIERDTHVVMHTFTYTQLHTYPHLRTHTCTHLQFYIHTITYAHAHMPILMNTHAHICIHTITYTCIHTYPHLHIHTHTHLHIYTHAYIYMHTLTYVHAHTYEHTYIHAHTHTCPYTLTYTHTLYTAIQYWISLNRQCRLRENIGNVVQRQLQQNTRNGGCTISKRECSTNAGYSRIQLEMLPALLIQ